MGRRRLRLILFPSTFCFRELSSLGASGPRHTRAAGKRVYKKDCAASRLVDEMVRQPHRNCVYALFGQTEQKKNAFFHISHTGIFKIHSKWFYTHYSLTSFWPLAFKGIRIGVGDFQICVSFKLENYFLAVEVDFFLIVGNMRVNYSILNPKYHNQDVLT